MTAKKICDEALALLGYSENNGNIQLTQRTLNRIIPLINLVYRDVCDIAGIEYTEIKTLSDKVNIPNKAKNVLFCGLAGYIAGAEGDDTSQSFWAAEYSARRTKLSQITQTKDVIPTVLY